MFTHCTVLQGGVVTIGCSYDLDYKLLPLSLSPLQRKAGSCSSQKITRKAEKSVEKDTRTLAFWKVQQVYFIFAEIV